jgi:hypothetical protein
MFLFCQHAERGVWQKTKDSPIRRKKQKVHGQAHWPSQDASISGDPNHSLPLKNCKLMAFKAVYFLQPNL